MSERFSRTKMLLSSEGIELLKNSRVAVFGVGGVGGFAVEALARSGVGTLDLIDNDRVSLTNINRQIIALTSTVGMYKTEAAKQRIADISPDTTVNIHNCFFMPETADMFDFSQYDYVIDAIDTVTGKIEIIKQADRAGTPVISSMGAGNKLDPTAFKVADIYKTSVCPLAKVMRHELKKAGIKKLKCVYSEEPPIKLSDEQQAICADEKPDGRRAIPGSVAFVPSVAGLIIAGEVIKDLAAIHNS